MRRKFRGVEEQQVGTVAREGAETLPHAHAEVFFDRKGAAWRRSSVRPKACWEEIREPDLFHGVDSIEHARVHVIAEDVKLRSAIGGDVPKMRRPSEEITPVGILDGKANV